MLAQRVAVSSNASLVIDPFIFKREEWETEGVWPNVAIKGIPGTWCQRNRQWPKFLLAIVCCPACCRNIIVHGEVSTIDILGKVSPSFQHAGCSFHRNIFLDKWNDKPLYACAIYRENGKTEIIYTHAQDAREARMHLGPGNYQITAIGPAIGFFVQDKHGDKLSAD